MKKIRERGQHKSSILLLLNKDDFDFDEDDYPSAIEKAMEEAFEKLLEKQIEIESNNGPI